MKLLMKRSSIARLTSASVLAAILAATAPTATAYAGDLADCEDGECAVGDPPTEDPSPLKAMEADEPESDSEGPGSIDDTDNDDDDGESDSETEGRGQF